MEGVFPRVGVVDDYFNHGLRGEDEGVRVGAVDLGDGRVGRGGEGGVEGGDFGGDVGDVVEKGTRAALDFLLENFNVFFMWFIGEERRGEGMRGDSLVGAVAEIVHYYGEVDLLVGLGQERLLVVGNEGKVVKGVEFIH
jgi:hypothetical protein